MRSIWFEEQETQRAIGKGAVGIVRVVPMLESREIPVDSADEGVARIVALWEGK